VIGDWGYDYWCHGNVPKVGCQQAIADKMLQKMEELGDVKFVINVGDSFYPHGVVSKNDPQWETKWRQVYHQKLRDVPWYSVYGNHDLQHDKCAYSDDLADCAQVNDDPDNLAFFYMPSLNWFKEHPELGLEVVALELNHLMLGWDKSRTAAEQEFEDCQYTSSKERCIETARKRAGEAFELFKERAAATSAKNLLVFSHYPMDFFTAAAPEFLDQLKDNSRYSLFYFGGHRHNVDNSTTASILPNVNWLVGGGGGWSCDGSDQGFLVGEIGEDFGIHTYPVFVEKGLCCQPPNPSMWAGGEECAWLGCDNCIDPKFCHCRDLNPDGPCTACPNPTSRHIVCSGSDCAHWVGEVGNRSFAA